MIEAVITLSIEAPQRARCTFLALCAWRGLRVPDVAAKQVCDRRVQIAAVLEPPLSDLEAREAA
jgi:hypothetical protein